MENKTVSASSNPDLANKLVDEALEAEEQVVEKADIKEPFNGVVDLPVGYVTRSGEVLRTAEVRELTGKDEEFVVRQGTVGKAIISVVDRATVSLGDQDATPEMMAQLLMGDRDALAIGIYRATFGDYVELGGACDVCGEVQMVEVDLSSDIETKVLANPVEEVGFEFVGRKGTYKVRLPNGKAQKSLLTATDKSAPELQTLLLENCVVSINGNPVVSPVQVQNMNLKDRKDLIQEINDRNPGPQFAPIEVDCPECDGKVVVPISLGAIFRF